MQQDVFREKLSNRQLLKGMWLAAGSSVIAEALSYTGVDFLVLDMEHAPNDITTAILQLQAIQNGSAAALVRVPENNPVWIKKALDIGSRHLLIPMINSAQEAKQAVSSAMYPPRGIRGVGSQHRACRYGLNKVDYFQYANDETTLIAQIETKEAVHELEAIASVEGIHALFVGPSDLSASLGHLGDTQNSSVQIVFQDIAKRCQAIQKPIGVLASTLESAKNYLEMGYTFAAIGSDLSFIIEGALQISK